MTDARPLAAILDDPILKLLMVKRVLADVDGEHWDTAGQLRLIEDDLAALNRFELAGALGYVDNA